MAENDECWSKQKVLKFFNINEDVIKKFKQLLADSTSPVIERSAASLSEDFLLFESGSFNSKQEEVDFYLRDHDTNIEMLDKYPLIKNLL